MPKRYVPKLSRDEMERRRLAAIDDLKALDDKSSDITQQDIARKYNVNQSTVSRWKKTLDESSAEGLKRSNPPGAEPRLNEKDLKRLENILLDGARAYGFETDLWTGPRIAHVIEKEFGVTYHETYVPQLLRDRLGFSYQKPERVPRERDEEKREQWLKTTWKEVKKGRSKKDG